MSNKKQKRKSEVWEHFESPDGRQRAICKYCDKNLSGNSKAGTSHLKRHIITCKKRPLGGVNNDQPSKLVPNYDQAVNVGLNIPDKSNKTWEAEVQKAIVAEVPFASSDYKQFWYSLTGPMDTEKEIYKYFQQEKEKLVAELQNLTSRISFTFEVLEEAGYMSLSAHFINNDFNLVKRLIGFRKLPDFSSAAGKTCIMGSCISDWNLVNKTLSFVTDWDSHMVDSLREMFGHKALLKEKILLPCLRKTVAELYYSQKIRWSEEHEQVLKFVKEKKIELPHHMDNFNQIAKEKGLPSINKGWLKSRSKCGLSVSDKWKFSSSVIKVLREALRYKEVLCQYGSTKKFPISEIEVQAIKWERAEEAVECFELIDPIMHEISNYAKPTSNLYSQRLIKICDMFEGEFDVEVIYERLDFHENIFSVAVILDPRYKLRFFEYYYKKTTPDSIIERYPFRVEDNIKPIREFFETLFHKYAEEVVSDKASSLPVGISSTEGHTVTEGFTSYIEHLKATKAFELNEYLHEKTADLGDLNFDLLGWWKQNRLRYPVLCRMARDVLAIPACVYSVTDHLLSSDLSALREVSPQIVEAVICSKDWILSNV